MTLDLNQATCEDMLAAIGADVEAAGGGSITLGLYTSGDVLLVTFTLPSNAFSAATGRFLRNTVGQISATAASTGTAAKAVLTNAAALVVARWTVSLPSGSGDAKIAAVQVTSGSTQYLDVLSFGLGLDGQVTPYMFATLS